MYMFMFSLLYTRFNNEVSPFLCIVEFSTEVFGKICVGPVRWVVLLHELHDVRLGLSLPEPPKPFTAHRRDRIDSPGNKHSDLSIVIPVWYRPRVDAFPVGLVFLTISITYKNAKNYNEDRKHHLCYPGHFHNIHNKAMMGG